MLEPGLHVRNSLLAGSISVIHISRSVEQCTQSNGGGRNELGPSRFASVYTNGIGLLNSNVFLNGNNLYYICITFAKETNACAEYRRVTFVTVLKHLIL